MGLSAHDQTFALRVDLKEITELSSVKKQAGAELYPKIPKKFKKVRKKSEKHQIFRKLAADSSADASADAPPRINISFFQQKSTHLDCYIKQLWGTHFFNPTTPPTPPG